MASDKVYRNRGSSAAQSCPVLSRLRSGGQRQGLGREAPPLPRAVHFCRLLSSAKGQMPSEMNRAIEAAALPKLSGAVGCCPVLRDGWPATWTRKRGHGAVQSCLGLSAAVWC